MKKDFTSWMSSRIRAASRGTILNMRTGEYVDVATARAEVFLDHTAERAAFYRENEAALIELSARDQAKADSSDPFIRDRVRTHLRGGLCELDDYGVEFSRSTMTSRDDRGNVIAVYVFDKPINMRRP